MAINLYLADRCGGPLWPNGVHERRPVYRWSFWVEAAVSR